MRIRLNLVISAAAQPTLYRVLMSEPADCRAALLKEMALAGLLFTKGARPADAAAQLTEPAQPGEDSGHAAKPTAKAAPKKAAQPEKPALDIEGQLDGVDDLGLAL